MTANTGAPWSIVFQELSDPADICGAVQDLADSADVAVQALYDAAALGAAKPAGRMATATAQATVSGVPIDMTWPAGSEYFDNDGMIDNTITTDRITFNSTGIYMVSIRCTFQSVAGAGIRQASITSSGAPGLVSQKAQAGVSGSDGVVHTLTVFPVTAAGQFVQFAALQTAGVAANLLTRQAQAFRVSTI